MSADQQGVFEAMQTLLSPVDRAELTGEIAAYLAAATAEGLAPGVEGMRGDDQAFMHPWGFELATIPGPLRIYHGRHDRFVPVSHGEWLVAHIPAAEAHISEQDGHLTLYTRGARECHAWFAELLAGCVRLSKGAGIDQLATTLMNPGDCWRTRPGEVHTVEALEPSEILEASTPQLDDVIRLMDDYGRASDRSPPVRTSRCRGRRDGCP